MATPKGFIENRELRKLDMKGLNDLLKELQQKLFKTSFEVKSGQSKRSDLVSKYKRQIARVKTTMSDKETQSPAESKASDAKSKEIEAEKVSA